MRINIINGPFLPVGGGPSGAVEKRWLNVGKVFVARGHQVTMLGRRWPELPDEEQCDGVSIIRRGGFKRSKSTRYDLVRDLFYSLHILLNLRQADITVCNAFWLPVILSLRKGKAGKIVVNVARFPKGQMRLYRRVDRLSAVSSAVADEIKRQTPEVADLVRVIPNPVDLTRFQPDNPLPPHGSYRVLYTGRIHPEKGIHVLIEAIGKVYQEFPKLQLSLVGPSAVEHGGGGGEYMARLEALARGLPVKFEENITDPDRLAQRMKQADFYCYPSLADMGESFGVAPLEAMALGYAPILTKLACFRDFASDGESCFVFDHHDSDPAGRLAEKLGEAMGDAEKTRRLGRVAIEVSQEFSNEKIAQLYEEDWEALIAGIMQGDKGSIR